MSHTFGVPAKPARITLDTLPQLFAHHRARFGGWAMVADSSDDPEQQERPDGVSDEEWTALGDPGRAAILREREARQTAERALAAARAKPAPPKTAPPKSASKPPAPVASETPDLAALIQQAVAEAVKPFAEAESQRQTEAAAERVRQAVLDAAKPLLHDASDALSGVDLAGVVDEQGHADTGKIDAALKDLMTRKPHLAKSIGRQAPAGIGGGGPVGVAEADKIKAVLADMQRATGVRPRSAS